MSDENNVVTHSRFSLRSVGQFLNQYRAAEAILTPIFNRVFWGNLIITAVLIFLSFAIGFILASSSGFPEDDHRARVFFSLAGGGVILILFGIKLTSIAYTPRHRRVSSWVFYSGMPLAIGGMAYIGYLTISQS